MAFAAWKSRVAQYSVGLAWSLYWERISMQSSTMKRWHDDYPSTYREWRKHYLSHVESNVDHNPVPGQDPYEIDCDCDQQKGRFRKRNAGDCGNTRCYLCHSLKFPKRQMTWQETCSQLKLKEGIAAAVEDKNGGPAARD